MVKIIIGFVVLAVVALVVMNMGGHVDMGGEHAAQESMKSEAKPETAAPAAPAAPAAATPAAPAAPAAGEAAPAK